MRANKLRELLRANKPTLSTHIHTTWPSVVEAIGHTGLYDYVEFVGEYGPFDLHDLDNLARAADIYNMSMQLKVDQEPRGFLAQRAIGSGFHSILFADCRSAADVEECVRITRPETPEDKGTYGVATRRFTYMGYGGGKAYVQALRDIVVAIMIEKPGTVDTLEECLSVKGVDMVQWGGSDYSMGIGRAGERYTPELREVERRVFETAIKMGVPPAPRSPARTRRSTSSTWASGTSPSVPTSRSCTSGGSPRVRTCARRSAADRFSRSLIGQKTQNDLVEVAGHVLIDEAVGVDHAGDHEPAPRVDGASRRARDPRRHLRNRSTLHPDAMDAVDALTGVDDAAAADDQIELCHADSPGFALGRIPHTPQVELQ